MLNVVTLIGRLTKEPDVRYGNISGSAQKENGNSQVVAHFTLAVKRLAEGTDFIRCTAFDQQAVNAEKYLYKGCIVSVMGRIRTGSYTDRDGKRVYTTEIIVKEFTFLPQGAGKESALPEMEGEGFLEIPEEELEGLPFR